ncbi:MAG: ComEC/Rec2 family competence protein [Candidatus Komeilibacteria bacterium]
MKKYRKYIFVIIGIALSLIIVYLQTDTDNIAKIVFLDIGQGDAILIITPDKERILIDGGPGNYLISKLGPYLSFYDKSIDLMILTHAHDDHVSGLNEVLKRYSVNLILFPGYIDYMAASYLEWLQLIEDNSFTLESTIAGDIYTFKNSSLEIVYPFEEYVGQKADDVNDTSVVAKYCYIEVCVLLTGDATIDVEEKILVSGQDVSADILKVAHHGSQYSNSEDWLKAVNASTAVIQSGVDNKFKHPHLRIIKRLEKLGIRILRNDNLGDIVINTDGYNYWLK